MEKFQKIVDKLNAFLLEYCKSNRAVLDIAIKDLINGGGKRLRPILVILAGRFGKVDLDKLLSIAAGIELLHMATLVHDDIIDEARLRRGEITAQERFGKNVAVFVGDYLLAKSYTLFTDHLSRHSLMKLNKIVRLVCAGEIDQFEGKYSIDLSIYDYFKRIRRKTALLFAISTYMGAHESGVRDKPLYHLYNFALEIGMTFQIQDDLLDFVGQEKKTGKKIGQDLAAGIYTLPIICLMKSDEYRAQTREILTRDSITEDEIQLITEMVYDNNAFEESKTLGQKFLDKAVDNLNQLPDIEAKNDLKYILDWQLKRQI
ncbi:MAG: polyprenyl synthetase family protein [Halanaerobiales bacterium]